MIYSLSPYFYEVLCRVYKAFGVESRDVCVKSYRSITQEQNHANQFFQNLLTDPFAPLEYQVPVKRADGTLTGQTVLKRCTVASLMSLDRNAPNSERALRTIMDRAIAEGFVTLTRPSDAERAQLLRSPTFVTTQTRDPMFADPALGILRYPTQYGPRQMRDAANPNNPLLVPDWFPQAKEPRSVYYTPRVLSTSLVTNERLRTLYESLILAIHTYLKDRNAPMYCHPGVIVCQGPMYVDRDAYTNLDPGYQEYINQFRTDNGDSEYLIRNTILGFKIPGSDPTRINFFPPYNRNWLESLERRSPVTTHGDGTTITRGSLYRGEERRTWHLYTADATFELLKWLNFAQQLLDSGNIAVNEATQQDARASMVHMFANQAVYTHAQDIAYRQVGLERGQNVLGYQQQLQREANARKASARTALIRSVAPGYTSTGDDVADVTAASINTVGLAFSGAIATGDPSTGVVSAALAGIALIIGFIPTFDTYRDPYQLPMRSTDGGPYLYGISPRVALESPPAYRIS